MVDRLGWLQVGDGGDLHGDFTVGTALKECLQLKLVKKHGT